VNAKHLLAPALAALVLLPRGALAEDGFGLDLTDPDPVAEEEAPVSAEDLAQMQLEMPDLGEAVGPEGESDTALGDRVKAVQRKHFLKRGRLEAVPSFALSLNDAFNSKVGAGLALNYHLADSIAVSVHYDQFYRAQSDNVRIAKRELRSLLLASAIDWSTGLDFVWTPIYGKLAWFNTIVQYDLFLSTGAGAVWSQTSGAPVNDGLHPAVSAGIGQRFAFTDWMAFEFWVRQLLYADRPQDRSISEIQKVLTMNVGLSFWLPPSFEYEVQ
jgi:outer membrane beta-barrel protein